MSRQGEQYETLALLLGWQFYDPPRTRKNFGGHWWRELQTSDPNNSNKFGLTVGRHEGKGVWISASAMTAVLYDTQEVTPKVTGAWPTRRVR
jgi:hypothetical protein